MKNKLILAPFIEYFSEKGEIMNKNHLQYWLWLCQSIILKNHLTSILQRWWCTYVRDAKEEDILDEERHRCGKI
jgi:hypothetical protein